jgi:hypothetical protein
MLLQGSVDVMKVWRIGEKVFVWFQVIELRTPSIIGRIICIGVLGKVWHTLFVDSRRVWYGCDNSLFFST